jgi:hypothetical protein
MSADGFSPTPNRDSNLKPAPFRPIICLCDAASGGGPSFQNQDEFVRSTRVAIGSITSGEKPDQSLLAMAFVAVPGKSTQMGQEQEPTE